jgi:hypothetical protein
MLRGIIGTKREEATEGCRKMHNEKLYGLCSLEKML